MRSSSAPGRRDQWNATRDSSTARSIVATAGLPRRRHGEPALPCPGTATGRRRAVCPVTWSRPAALGRHHRTLFVSGSVEHGRAALIAGRPPGHALPAPAAADMNLRRHQIATGLRCYPERKAAPDMSRTTRRTRQAWNVDHDPPVHPKVHDTGDACLLGVNWRTSLG